MKKILLSLVSILLFTGCTFPLMGNTPTKTVEDLFTKYQTLDETITNQLDQIMIDDTVLTNDQKDRYKDIMKKQYQDLAYTVKDEIIDGDNATVEVEIEVYDYDNSLDNAATYLATTPDDLYDDDGNLDEEAYTDYKLTKMEEEEERIKYTLTITLTKVDKDWTLDSLTTAQLEKIHGVYNYD